MTKLDFPHEDDNHWIKIEVGGVVREQYPSPLEVKMMLEEQRVEILKKALELVDNYPKWVLVPTDPLLNWKKGQNERDELIREVLQAKKDH